MNKSMGYVIMLVVMSLTIMLAIIMNLIVMKTVEADINNNMKGFKRKYFNNKRKNSGQSRMSTKI